MIIFYMHTIYLDIALVHIYNNERLFFGIPLYSVSNMELQIVQWQHKVHQLTAVLDDML